MPNPRNSQRLGRAELLDVGAYGTDPHGCTYCYAVSGAEKTARAHATHDPAAPMVTGYPTGAEIVTDRTKIHINQCGTASYKDHAMFRIGCHLSSSKGFLAMGKEAVRLGANTFQFFTRNPRGSAAKPLDLADIAAYLAYAEEHGLTSFLAHAPYTLNACAAESAIREFARATMADDLARLEHTPGCAYNFHPGSHVSQGMGVAVPYIIEMLNEVIKPEQSTTLLLETMAGKGSEVGGTFEELRAIIDGVVLKDHIGVCLDTCHVFDGGYDIVNNLEGVLEQFDKTIGLRQLKAIHLNDSKNPLGSRKDRHEFLGQGHIGQEAIARIINHPELRELPFYLETPEGGPGYDVEISMLKQYRKAA